MGSDMADSGDARDIWGYLCLDHHLFMVNRSRLRGLAGGQEKERKACGLARPKKLGLKLMSQPL
jgi:hypothetical protein